jgi:hypothetical protein
MKKTDQIMRINRGSVIIAITFIMAVTASCSSTSSNAIGLHTSTTKKESITALLNNAYIKGIDSQNIDGNFSMKIIGSGILQNIT